jgi:Domain of unknown function (DUF4157)/D-alanyl-D-alanine carboxypeptidase
MSEYESKQRAHRLAHPDVPTPAPSPGKRTRVEQSYPPATPVQLRATTEDEPGPRAAARHDGAPQASPGASRIERVFGGHVQSEGHGRGAAIQRAADPEASRITQLEADYRNALAAKDWPRAGELLNAFNREDILARLGALSRDDLAALHAGARDNPKVGPDSQVAQLTRPSVVEAPGPPAAAPPAAAPPAAAPPAAAPPAAAPPAAAPPAAASPAAGGTYTADDAKAVADNWTAHGSVTETTTSELGQTAAFRDWKLHAAAAIAAAIKARALTAARAQELRDWIGKLDAHDKWKVDRAGAEPGDPGALPAELPGLTYVVHKASVALGPPPTATWEHKRQYAVTTVDGSSYKYKDHVESPNTRYDAGVGSSGSVGGKAKIADVFDKAGVPAPDPATVKKVFSILSSLEGKFDAINTYDAGFISAGFIQFISGKAGTGSLVSVLRDMKAKAAAEFDTHFHSVGIDVDAKGLVVVDPDSGAVLHGEAAVKKVMDDKRLAAAFQAAGAKSSEFQYAQARIAYAQYYMPDKQFSVVLRVKDPSRPKQTVTVSGRYGDVLRSDAGKVASVDRAVQHGTGPGGGAAGTFDHACQAVVDRHGLVAVDVATLAGYEVEIVRKLHNRYNELGDGSLTQPPAAPASNAPAPAATTPAATGAAPVPAVQPKAAGPLDAGIALPPPGGGRPLDEATAARMQRALGADFRDVRVHEGDAASRLGARAYAQGSDLHFAPGQYAPGTRAGDELIGHELAHVVQQRAGRVATPQGKGAPIHDAPDLEAEADRLGALAASGASEVAAEPGATTTGSTSGSVGPIQRSPDAEADPGNQLDQDYRAALAGKDWPRAGELLNAFNREDIMARLGAISRGERAALHVGARDNPKVGPDSQAAQLTRPSFLDLNFETECQAGNWAAAASFLNGFNDADILARVRKLSSDDQRAQLKAAAAAYDRVVKAVDAVASEHAPGATGAGATDGKPADGTGQPPANKGSWTAPTADHYPFESEDPRVLRHTTVYQGNPPPPDGWRYWPRGKKIRPRAKQMADEAITKPAGTFLQDMVHGELIGVRTEWHSYTVLYDKETKKPYQKDGLYRGGSLMVPLVQPKPDPAPSEAATQGAAPSDAATKDPAAADPAKSGTEGEQAPAPATVAPGTAALKRPHGLQEILQVFGKPGTNLGVHKIRCGRGGAIKSVYCHNKIAPLLQAAFEQIFQDGKAEHIHHFDGCYNDRQVDGAEKRSAHAWGIAFDINPRGNGRVASDTPEDKIPVSDSQKILAPYFEAQGFVWGKAFGDAMHFQYCTGY